jgi:hypothetical protein
MKPYEIAKNRFNGKPQEPFIEFCSSDGLLEAMMDGNGWMYLSSRSKYGCNPVSLEDFCRWYLGLDKGTDVPRSEAD